MASILAYELVLLTLLCCIVTSFMAHSTSYFLHHNLCRINQPQCMYSPISKVSEIFIPLFSVAAVVECLVFFGGMRSQLTSGLWIENLGFVAPYWFIFVCLLSSVLYIIVFVPESRASSSTVDKKLIMCKLFSLSRIKRVGFVAPYWFIFVCLLSSVLYIIVFVPESRASSSTVDKKLIMCKLFSLSRIKRVWYVYKYPRNGARRNLVIFTLCCGVTVLTTLGVSGVVVLFLLHSPLCFSAEKVGYFSAFRYFSQGLGAVLGIKLLGRCVNEFPLHYRCLCLDSPKWNGWCLRVSTVLLPSNTSILVARIFFWSHSLL